MKSLIAVGTTGGLPRVLEVASPKDPRQGTWPGLGRALKLLVACKASRLRVELEGPWPRGAESWIAELEDASERAFGSGKEFDCVLRGKGNLSTRAARRLALLGTKLVLETSPGDPGLEALRRRQVRLGRMRLQTVVEVALSPEDIPSLRARLERLEVLSPANVRFTTRAGKPWGAAAMRAAQGPLTMWLEGLLRRGGDRPPILDVLNFFEEEEPELLTPRLRLTAEAAVGWATALRHRDLWPELLRSSPYVPLGDVEKLDALFTDTAERQKFATKVLPEASRDLWHDNVGFALRLRDFFQRPFRGFRDRSENKTLRRGLLESGLIDQSRFTRLRLPGVESAFLFVRSGCLSDCIFCKRKIEDPGQTAEEIDDFLKDNLLIRRRKIALVGNEPLLHSRILQVVRACRRYGFKEVEIMTSGTILADMAVAKALKKAGATGFSVPLYSDDPSEHDAITAHEGSFREAVLGIENLKRLGLKVFVHANLMRQNIHSLARLEKLALRGWKVPFSILCLRPKDPDSMNLHYGQVDPSYREVLAAGLKVGTLVGFPVCIQRRIQGDVVRDPGSMADGIKLYLLHQNFVKPDSCQSCPDSQRCLGTFREHLGLYPGDIPLLVP